MVYILILIPILITTLVVAYIREIGHSGSLVPLKIKIPGKSDLRFSKY